MMTSRDIERLVADHYGSEPASRAPAHLLATVIAEIGVTRQRRPWVVGPPRHRSRAWVVGVVAAAALAVAVGTLWGALVWTGPATPSLPPAVPSVDPAPAVIEPFGWSPARLGRDWPAPVRPEPGGEPAIVTMGLEGATFDSTTGIFEPSRYDDAIGDVPVDGVGWLDLTAVTGGLGHIANFRLMFASGVPLPLPDPADRWIAYGVVLDTDRDGTGDIRLGIDNLPDGSHRAWRTVLADGTTQAAAGPPYATVGSGRAAGSGDGRYGIGSVGFDSYYPGEDGADSMRATLRYSMQPGETEAPFYAWAAMVEDGQVVATDYAPDAGWLVQAPQPGLTLVGPTWSVGYWSRDGVMVQMPETETQGVSVFVRFTADGRVLTDAACGMGDSIEGDVNIDGDRIRITNLPVPDRPCQGIATGVDVAILEILNAPEIVYRITGPNLRFDAGNLRLGLSAEDAPLP